MTEKGETKADRLAERKERLAERKEEAKLDEDIHLKRMARFVASDIAIEKQNELLATANKLRESRAQAELAFARGTGAANDVIERLTSALFDAEDATAKFQNKLGEDKNIKGLVDQLGNMIGITKNYEKTMLGSIDSMLKTKGGFKKLAGGMAKTVFSGAATFSVLQKVKEATIELFYEQDKALVSFNRSTGAAREYGAQITKLESDMWHAGISMSEAGESMGSLVTNIHQLKGMTKSTQNSMLKTAAILSELGVNADTTAKNMNYMVASLGFTGKQAATTQRELFTLAQSLSMPPDAMASSFADAMPVLAAFGKESTEVFKTLAVNARDAGMEVSEILSIVEQFDTFDSAAQSVGRLNALLGGSFLNSLEMVTTTDPTERMKLLSDAINESGQSFDSMDYYTRKAIASAAGLKDVNQLALVMRGNFDLAAGGPAKSAAEIEKLAAQTQEFNTIMDEMKELMRLFAVQLSESGLIEGIKNLINFVSFMNEKAPGLVKILPAIGIGLFGISSGFKAIRTSTKGGIAGLAVSLGTLIPLLIRMMPVSNATKVALMGIAGAIGVVSAAFIAMHASSAGITVAIGILAASLAILLQALAQWNYAETVGNSPSFQETRKVQIDQTEESALAVEHLHKVQSKQTKMESSASNQRSRIGKARQSEKSAISASASSPQPISVVVNHSNDDSKLVKSMVDVQVEGARQIKTKRQNKTKLRQTALRHA